VTTHTYSVPDLSCSHCVRTVEQAVRDIPGFQGCSVDLVQKRVVVDLADDTHVTVVAERLLDAGYPAQAIAASG
jgi:copper chaperone